MPLDAVRNTDTFESNTTELTTPFDIISKWKGFPVSNISHHGKLCCELALEWLHAMDYSLLNDGSKLTGPRWISQRFSWGPTKWPIHWCEAVLEKNLDCGAQSALAHEIFCRRGVKSFRIQLVQEFSSDATRQWSEKWNSADTSIYWIDENLIYHECCAITKSDRALKVWDGSAGCWINPNQFSGYGSVRALRLVHEDSVNMSFNWGGNIIVANKWQDIKNK